MRAGPVVAWCAVAALAATAPARAATIAVPAGGDLHAALLTAQPGDTIALERGASFIGNFTLPQKAGSGTITIRTAGRDAVPAGTRVGPQAAAGLAQLRSPNSQPALQTAPGAHHWLIELIDVGSTANGAADLIALGDGSPAQATLANVPHDLVLDRVYVHGDPANGAKRCVALNSAATTIESSYFADCKAVGQDSQAIGGWNGPGPFTITNNYLEAAGENLLFGGADPSIPGLVPSDITVTGNVFAKRPEWRTQSWQVKNLLELKNARRVTVRGNTFRYNWQAAQSGYAILFTVRNQDGHCPWCEVSDVTFARNLVQHSAGGVSILGVDDNFPSAQTHAIQIANNVFADIDNEHWGGSGYFLLLTGGPRNIVVDHNTIIQDHASGLIQIDGPPVLQFQFTNNLAKHNAYGIIGTNHGPGNDTIRAFLPAAEIAGNVIADGDAGRYPGGNQFPSSAQFASQFVAYDAGDYRLAASSAWRTGATDGTALGANVTRIAEPRDRP